MHGSTRVTSDPAKSESEFARHHIVLILLIGAIGGLNTSLQPLLLGQLAAEGRLAMEQIGRAALAEAIGMAVSAGLAGAFLPYRRLRSIIAIAGVLSISANLATPFLQGSSVILVRMASGAASGLLIWLWAGMLIRVATPARLIGIYVTVQPAAQFALAALFARMAQLHVGSAGSYMLLALLGAAVIGFALAIPTAFSVKAGAGVSGLPPSRGLIGLGAVALHLAAIMAIWVYIVPVAAWRGHSLAAAGYIVSISFIIQIVAGLCATALATRFRPFFGLLLCIGISLGALALLTVHGSSLPLVAATCTIAFLWVFTPPLQMPFLLALDPTGKAALQMATAQIVGIGVGPAIASLLVGRVGPAGAIGASTVLFLAAALIVLLVSLSARRNVRNG